MANLAPSTAEPLFESAHHALVFAFNHALQASPKLPMTYGRKVAISGKGLGGLDGAVQSGFIREQVSRLNMLRRNLVIARYAPKSTPCSCRSACCSGHRANPEFHEAIAEISTEAYKAVLVGSLSSNRLRRGIVEKYFGRRINFGELADICEVNRDTAGDHNAKIVRLLEKEEPKALDEIGYLLKVAGMIF